ncbi:LuxR C-terminal-related transcriptional regulator [uncultured Desulfosarcina sp.]|uniref:LuxR C-terminal-related transcriptional regulator n=1 Tax=uncultured Desulfosarcina sp. TaxID=218289 RepID=UPI0029C87D6F|nr:LuxR C-terminal-related transcriptional regulator [uncultured Desulfosarcina sp.]
MHENSEVQPNHTPMPLCYSSEEARTVLDSLSAHIAIMDNHGVILDTNHAWRDFAVKSGMPEDYDSIGDNYLAICDAADGENGADARTVADGIREVIAGRVDEFIYDYPCHSADGPHWYYMRAIRMSGEGPLRVVVSHEEITALKLSEEALRKSEAQLTQQKIELEESNIALKVLLKQREGDKSELEQKVITNVKEMVLPYLEKLKRVNLKPKDKTVVDIIDSHLRDIISPMMQKLANASIILTPQEIQVASLVKDGKASKEIADILNVSETTVHFHRKNLRRKFGLSNSQTNLRSYLISIS